MCFDLSHAFSAQIMDVTSCDGLQPRGNLEKSRNVPVLLHYDARRSNTTDDISCLTRRLRSCKLVEMGMQGGRASVLGCVLSSPGLCARSSFAANTPI